MTNQNIVSLTDEQNSADGMLAVESSKAVQEVQASLVIAKRFPRDEAAAQKKIMKACARPTLADAGIYTYARGGNEIAGPSIRLAEAIAQYWGNLDFGWRELDRKGGSSTIQAYCWDKETNTRREMTFENKLVRSTKRGNYALTSERDIYEHNANQAARRMRACILALIPGDVVEDAVDQCELTIQSQISPDKLQALLNAFGAYKVNQKMIEARIQRNFDSIQPSQVVDLRKVYNSLKDGMSNIAQWFDVTLGDPEQAETKPVEQTSLDQFKDEQSQGDPEPVEEGDPEPEDNPGSAPVAADDQFPGDMPNG